MQDWSYRRCNAGCQLEVLSLLHSNKEHSQVHFKYKTKAYKLET